MAGNSGAWGVALFNTRTGEWVSLSGGDPVDPYLPSEPVGCLTVPPDGMGVPALRTEDVTFTHRDGVRMYSDWYENRIITLTVIVCNDGCPGCPTGRAKVRDILNAWSRRCGETELRIFTDCHDPSLAEPEVTGPYSIIGRPRQALLSWRRSNIGCADLTLRFDALDHRLIIPGQDGEFEQCSPSLLAQEVRTNLARDPNLRNEAAWTNFGGSTGTVTTGTSLAPFNLGYIRYEMDTSNTSSPMYLDPAGTGIGSIPVVEGRTYTLSCYWRSNSNVSSENQLFAAVWFDAAGVEISAENGDDLNPGALGGLWWRGIDSFTAPAGAAFLAPRIIWSGTYGVGSVLDNACFMVEESAEGGPWFSGNFLGTWLGDPDASTSTSPYTRRNQVANPLPTPPAGDTWSVASNSTATWTVDTSGGPDTSDPTIAFPGTQVAGFHRISWPSGGVFNWFRPDFIWQQESPQQAGTPFRVAAWVRVNQSVAGLELQATQYETGNASGIPADVVSLDGIAVDTWTLVEVSGVIGSDLVSFVSPEFSASSTPLAIPTGFELHISLVIVEYNPVEPEIYFDGSSDGAAWGVAANGSISGISFVEFSEVEVEGDLCASLTIELTGPLTAPIIVQETTPDNPNYGVENGRFVQYNENIADGEVVTIDTATRSATSSTENFPVTGNVTGNLSWQMDPGPHLLSLSAAGGSGVGRVCWTASVVSG